MAPLLFLSLLFVMALATYLGNQRLSALNATTHKIEQQRMYLQMLFKGINEALLTDGTPDSVAIARKGITSFDETLRDLKQSADSKKLIEELAGEIEPKWTSLRDATAPFLRINDVNDENEELLILYGRLLYDAERLQQSLENFIGHSKAEAESSTGKIKTVVILIIIVALCSILWIFWYLYRVIAVPLNSLRKSMLEVSDGEGRLLERINTHLTGIPELVKRERKQEFTALNYAYQFMLTGFREHLIHRLDVEEKLQNLNLNLENRINVRTQALRDANRQMQEEISKHRKTMNFLERSRRHNERILEAAGDGIYGINLKERITFVNSAAARMLGCKVSDLKGMKVQKILSKSCIGDSSGSDQQCQIWDVLKRGESQQVEGELYRQKSGSLIPVEYMATPILENNKLLGAVVVFRDVSEKKKAEERIYRLAHYDELTELPNRTLFSEHVTQAITRTKRRMHGLAVMFLDLDHFKYVNDTHGHQFGDRLLGVIAKRIVDRLRPDDMLSRIGGDEFIILLSDIGKCEDVSRLAEQLIATVSEPVNIEGHQMSVGTSIGISLYPQDGRDIDMLQRNADTAMYQAKADGRGTFRYFDESMNRDTRERLEIEGALRQAIEEDGFELVYQPQVRIHDGVVVGVEALLRWANPQKGHIGPDKFIPIAENSGLIIPIGDWVLRTACHDYRQLVDAGLAPPRFSINLSAKQFLDKTLKEKIEDALTRYSIKPERLELELTESCVMEDPESSVAILGKLKQMGIQVAVDDFGVAYSSLNYLKRLPADRLKIDRSFIQNIPEDADDNAITATIIAMAHSLGLAVIAEGVETKAQLAFLIQKACNEVQGYLYSRPLSMQNLRDFLSQNRMPLGQPEPDENEKRAVCLQNR